MQYNITVPVFCYLGAVMTENVKLSTARELAAAGSVRETVLVGQRGGYAVLFKVGMGERALATKQGDTRLFGGVDAAARVLREIGIARYHVDATGLAEGDLLSRRRARPDRGEALRRTHRNAAFVADLVERAEAGRKDPVRLSSAEVNERMRALREPHQARRA